MYPIDRIHQRRTETLVEQAQNEYDLQVLQDAAKAVRPDDDGNWIPISGMTMDGKVLGDGEQQSLRAQAVKASLKSPLIAGFLKSMVRFVIGKNATFSPKVEDEDQSDVQNEVWHSWASKVGWDEREREIANRTWRDGECFIHRVRMPMMSNDGVSETLPWNDKQSRALMAMGIPADMGRPNDGRVMDIRLVDPDHINDPSGTFSHGIVTAPDDVEVIVGYLFCPSGKISDVSFIPAEDMIHLKIRVDRDVKRGRSLIEPMLALDEHYRQWLHYRIVLSRLRTAIAWVKKVAGSSAQRSSVRSDRQTQRNNNNARGEGRTQVPKAGTMVTASPGIDYDYKSPNLQAADAQNDGREIKLNMAVVSGLPEYMFTGDASNANFASTMVAESPGVREFEYWQDYFMTPFAIVWSWVQQAARDHGKHDLPDEILTPESVGVTFPPLLSRDELKETQANLIKNKGGILSRQTWAEGEGLAWEQERDRIQAERDELPPLSSFEDGE